MTQKLCLHPIYLKDLGFHVNCGHCRACRVMRRSEWVHRLEDQTTLYNGKCLFVTLTYDSKHLPLCGSICPTQTQRFLKRLRINISRSKEVPNVKFKYFYCGEYGSKTGRPHYHFIFMGLDSRYRKIIFDAWGKCIAAGYKCYQTANLKAFRYVCGYTNKKILIGYNSKFAKVFGQVPEFQRQSIGIGKDYALRVVSPATGLLPNGNIPPRYYRKVLNVDYRIYAALIHKRQLQTYAHLQALTSTPLGNIVTGTPIKSPNYYAGYLVNTLFWTLLNQCRTQCDSELKHAAATWRQNTPF